VHPERYERGAHSSIGYNLVVVCFEEEKQDTGNERDVPFLSKVELPG
jgi:hypothetical protein